MSQHDYIISNQTFPNTRSDLNNVLQAIATCNKGSSAPTTQYAGQMWIDDSAGTTWTLYLYDGSDNIQVATIDTTANTINFIDSVVSGFDIVTDTTPQLGGDLDTNGNDINFGDNDKAQFGASQDLQIYHDGSNSLIVDNGNGDLYIRASDNFNLQVGNGSGGWQDAIRTYDANRVDISYAGSVKLATTSTGIDITGTVLTDKAYIAESTLTDGATISWNMSTQSVAKVTLGGNRTLSAPTNGSTGQFASLLVIQDGTGSRTLTWNAVYEFASDTAPTLTTTGGKGDLFVFRYNGSKWLEVGRNLNLTLS